MNIRDYVSSKRAITVETKGALELKLWTLLGGFKAFAALSGKSLLVALLFMSASSYGAVWYVDSSITGTQDGKSWGTAWSSLSQVSGVAAGDTVYISGGPSGSSRTYSFGSASWSPQGGITGSPVAYRIGQDSQHNGTAVFDGTGSWISQNRNNLVISGDAGDNVRHFLLTSAWNMAATVDGWSNVRISYVDFGIQKRNYAVFDSSGRNLGGGFELDHCTGTMAGANADRFAFLSFKDQNNFDQSMIHDNLIFVPRNPANLGLGCDGFVCDGDGWSLYNNTLISYPTNTYSGGQHADGLQCFGGKFIKVYGNYVYNFSDIGLYIGMFGHTNATHVYLYNNIVVAPTGIGIAISADTATGMYFTDCIIANNFVFDGLVAGGFGEGTGHGTWSGCLIANNISVPNAFGTTGQPGQTMLNNASFSASSAPPNFVNYVVNGTNGNFHLVSAATSLIGTGTNLSRYFTLDKDGATRPSSGAWDIGPYRYGSSNISAITVTPSSVDFGSILAGTTADAILNVQNTGAGTLSGSATVSAPFSIVSGGSYSLSGGQSQAVTVRYAPTAAGTNSQNVSFTGGAGAVARMSGVGSAAPVLSVAPLSQNFGAVVVGSSATLALTVQNTGGGTLSGTATVSAPFSIVSGGSYNLSGGQSQTVTVRYAPTVAGTNSQSVSFTGGAGAVATVSGVGSVAPVLSVTPLSQNFGAVVVGSSASLAFTVQNTGGGTLSGTATASAPFSIVSGGSYNLSGGQSQTVTVRYAPTVVGTNSQNVSFTGGAGRSATVSGVGYIAPALTITPLSQDFGTVAVGASTNMAFTVLNSGGGTLSGAASIAAPFGVVAGGSYNLAAGQSQTVTVRYAPISAGTNIQNITFTGAGGAVANVRGVAVPTALGLMFQAVSGQVISPFVVTNGFIYQPIQTTVISNAGRATYNFAVSNAATYVIKTMVSAPNGGANSFYVNIDAEPQDPTMVWDIPVTTNFEERVISWRGAGTDTNNQFTPKTFNLTQGAHQLIICGREANAELQSLTFIQAPWVSLINQSGVSASVGGNQVPVGTVAQYSASASDPNNYPLTWQWIYTTNGGPGIVYQSGTGAVAPITYSYGAASAGLTYNWKIRVSNGYVTSESNLTVTVANVPAEPGYVFQASAGNLTAPFALTNGYIYQPVLTASATNGGRASYTFWITNQGDYIVQGTVNAPDTGANSFFLSIDAEPLNDTMIWDIPITVGFQTRTVSWRGNGTDTTNQYVPKVFSLSAGVHQLIIRGREANAQFQSFTIANKPVVPQNLRLTTAQ